MNEETKRERVQKAIDTELSFLNTTPGQRKNVLAAVMGERKTKRGVKLSFVLAMALMLLSLTLTAYAVTAAIRQYYANVAEMDAGGALIRWEMQDKIDFVNLMKEADFALNAEDFEIMNDAALPDAEREAAADRIIEERYGELILEQVGKWDDMGMEVRQNTLGLPPDETIIFKEQYLAEHPEGLNTLKDWMDFTDALGYYLRDEYYPAYEAAKGEEKDALPTRPPVDEAYAIQCLRSYMTEVLSWTPEAVEEMEPTTEWDKKFGVWTVSGEVSESSVRPEMEPVTKNKLVTKTETGYRLTLMVDSYGGINIAGDDLATFARIGQREHALPDRITNRQAEEIAGKAVREKYGLAEAELNRLFCDGERIGLGEEDGALYAMRFHTHFSYNQENIYCAYVNMVTGKADPVFSYRMEDLPKEWAILFFAAETERNGSWYSKWTVEQKRELANRMKDADILANLPQDDDLDATVTEAFGIPGYVSALNFTVMAHKLLGPEDGWDVPTRAVYDDLRGKYFIHSVDMTASLNSANREIDGNQAVQLVKEAVCAAWDMPANALDNWETVSQLRQDSTRNRSRIYYQVFLTRPKAERSENTFSGKNSMMYRIGIDGTVIDASVLPGWYSPAQDRAVTEEAKLYDVETWHYFTEYAQAHDLLDYGDFFHWPLANKAECGEEMRKMVEAKQQENPDYADQRLLAMMRHVYGLPGENDLSEGKAKEKAWEYLESAFDLNANETEWLKPVCSFFDIADPDKPVWKIVFSAEWNSYGANEAGLNTSLYYALRLDAQTGELLSAFTYGRMDGQTGIEAWDKWF